MSLDHGHLDAAALIAGHLHRVLDHDVFTSIDAGVGARALPVTIVTVPTMTQAGWLVRWDFQLTCVLTSFAESPAAARAAHLTAARAMLATPTTFDPPHRICALRCTQEPQELRPRPGPDWPGLASAYSLHLREESR